MRTLWLAAWLMLCLAQAGCELSSAGYRLPAQTSREERRILVTYVDRSIGQNVPANPADRYRAHGDYAASSWSSQVARELANQYDLRLIAEWPVTSLGVACVVYEAPEGRPLEEWLQRLGGDGRIDSAQKMNTFRALANTQGHGLPYNDPYYRLQAASKVLRVAAAHRWATGHGVRVAVIDAGVDQSHPDLAGQVINNAKLAPTDGDAAEVHGTAVAGIIAARPGNGVGIVGVAPGAEVHALRACWSERPGTVEALCNSFTLALALNEAIRLKPSIINLSLTGPDDPLLRQLLRKALESGTIVVAAIPSDNIGGFPANLDGVIGVSAASAGRIDTVVRGGLVAPGSEVLTTVPHAGYDFLSGSSFAAAHVSGLISLLLELHPGLNRDQVLRLLSRPDGKPVDACRAIAQLRGRPACPNDA